MSVPLSYRKFVLCILFFCTSVFSHAQDRLKEVGAFYEMIDSVVAHKNDPDKAVAMKFLNKAEAELGESAADYYYAVVENHRGSLYFNSGDLTNGGWYYMKAEALFSGYKDSVQYLVNKYNLGNYNLISYHYNSALQKYFSCIKGIRKQATRNHLKKSEQALLRKLEAACMSSIGSVFLLIHNEEEAIRYYISALDVFQLLEDKVSISHCYINISEAYMNLEEYDLALAYLKKGNELTGETGRKQDLGMNQMLYGRIYAGNNMPDSAVYHFKTSEELYERYNNDYGLHEVHIYHAKVNLKRGETDKAREKLQRSLSFFKEQDVPKFIARTYEILSDVEIKSGNWNEAIEYLERANEMKDRLVLEAEQNMATEMVSYITDERREFHDSLTILEQDVRRRQDEIELQRKSYTNRLLIFGLIFLVIVLLAVLLFLRRNRKVNRLLNRALENNRVLFREVHHRVKNNFQIISSLLSLQIGQSSDPKVKNQLDQMKSRILSMSFVHELLYKTNNTNEIEFTPYVEELSQSILKSFTPGKLKINCKVRSERYRFNLDTAIPLGLILNEAITNCAKYAFDPAIVEEQPMIEIELKKVSDEEFVLAIKDNGRGFSVESIEKEGDNLGLELIEILSEQLNGKFEINTDNGTTITVWFQEK